MDRIGYIFLGIATIIVTLIAWKATRAATTAKAERAEASRQLEPLKTKVAEMRELRSRIQASLAELKDEVSHYTLNYRIEADHLPHVNLTHWDNRITAYEEQIVYRRLNRFSQDVKADIVRIDSTITELKANLDVSRKFRQARTNAPNVMAQLAAKMAPLRKTMSHPDISYGVRKDFDEGVNGGYINLEGSIHEDPKDVDWLKFAINLEIVDRAVEIVEKRAEADIAEVAEARTEIKGYLDEIPELLEKSEEAIKAAPHQSPRAEKLLVDARQKFAEAKEKNGADRERVLETQRLLNETLAMINTANASDMRHREFIAAQS